MYCTHVCLSSYVYLEHKGTSFVLWKTPPRIPSHTSPRAAPSHTARCSQESQPRPRRSVRGSAPAALWGVSSLDYCLSALVCPPVKQAVRTKACCVSLTGLKFHIHLGSLAEGVHASCSSMHSTHMQGISAGLRTSGWLTGSRFCSRTLENRHGAQEI